MIVKGGRREVILSSKRRESESKDDEMGETNEEGDLGNEEVEGEGGSFEGSRGRKGKIEIEEREVEEEKVAIKVETEEMSEEREMDMEVSDRKVNSGENEVEDREMGETNVETPEIPQDEGNQEDVTGGVGINRERGGDSTKEEGNPEGAVTAEETKVPTDSEVKSTEPVQPMADTQEIEKNPEYENKQSETDSNMQVDPVQD